MSIVDDWYEIIDFSDELSLIREKYIAAWLRCNIWHVRGKERDLLIDTGMGLRSLKAEIAYPVRETSQRYIHALSFRSYRWRA